MSSDENGNAAAIIDFAKAYERAELHEVAFEGATEQVLVIAKDEGGTEIKRVRDLFADRAERPIRRKGTIVVYDLDSFVAATNFGSDKASAIFADVPGRKVTAVLDFHEPSNGTERGDPRWGQDRIEYGFTYSSQLKAWLDASVNRDGSPKWLSQKDFAALIDNRLGDMAEDVPADDSIAGRFAKQRAIKFADVVTMLVFTRSIAGKSAADTTTIYDDRTGGASVQYTKKNTVGTPDGAPVVVPDAFALTIPLLCGTKATRFTVAVRLRFDVSDGGKIAWNVEINALEQYVLLAIDEALDVVRGPRENPNPVAREGGMIVGSPTLATDFTPGCGLPVFMGVAPPTG